MSNVKLIGFIGLLGSGKSFATQTYIASHPHEICKKISFADGVREKAWALLNWSPKDEQEYINFKNTVWTPNNSILPNITGRQILQKIGTELFRAENPNVWVDIVKRKILKEFELHQKLYSNVPETEYKPLTILIDDVRYVNEVKMFFDFEQQDHIEIHLYYTAFNKSSINPDEHQHQSEKLALELLNKFNHLDEITDYMRETYIKMNVN